jgi:4-aminobutyrate aminotransferase-like enzyme/Ser/Thr protein kinase RdoA (MazF antagonist)
MVGSGFSLLEQITAFLQEHYTIAGEISRLPGENDNYRIKTGDGQQYILKLSGENLSRGAMELEHSLVEHLRKSELSLSFPHTVPNRHGEVLSALQIDAGAAVFARLSEYVPGTPWGEAGTIEPQLLRDLGSKLAAIDKALADFDDPRVHRSHRWDLTAASQHRAKIPLIEDDHLRMIAEWMFHFYAACALPNLTALPHSVIYGDANDENVLVEDAKVVGLLDFGDSLHNPRICELAVALAYAMLEQDDPLSAANEVVAGYHNVQPLSIPELEVLYPLVCARLCTTVVMAAERRKINPDHPTWFVTEARALALLKHLYQLAPFSVGKQIAAGIGIALFEDLGKSRDVLLQNRRGVIGPSLSISYEVPIKMVRGSGQYLYDEGGHPLLDLVNNVCHVGHCHPAVVEAGQRQMARLNTNTRYLYDGLTAYAERLCATLPDPLEICFFVNSGSEANELALRLAETYTGRRDFLVIDGAYHGHTGRLIDISPYKFKGPGGKGGPEPWVHVVPMPDGYRGVHKGQNRSVGIAYGDELGKVISKSEAPIAGFIAESLLGCAGQIIPPEGYFARAFEHVRKVGGVCILDEVQVGFGRVGTHFWAFERHGVVPDIVVMGKPIGNGHPMAAVVTTRQIADSFANGMEFFSTFGGNPVSCAIGMAVLDVIEAEKLQERALDLGTTLLEGLSALKQAYAIIGDVRGVGLFLGIEFVRDRKTLEPAAEAAAYVVERMKTRGVLLSTDGPLHNVIKIKPPMVLTREDIDMTLRLLDDELSALSLD